MSLKNRQDALRFLDAIPSMVNQHAIPYMLDVTGLSQEEVEAALQSGDLNVVEFATAFLESLREYYKDALLRVTKADATPPPKPHFNEAGHDWTLIIGMGEDAPGKSLDEVFWCQACGTVKHDYRHNGGERSPNYPDFFKPGGNEVRFGTECPPCTRVEPAPTKTAPPRMDDIALSIEKVMADCLARRQSAIEHAAAAYLIQSGVPLNEIEVVEETNPEQNTINWYVRQRTDKESKAKRYIVRRIDHWPGVPVREVGSDAEATCTAVQAKDGSMLAVPGVYREKSLKQWVIDIEGRTCLIYPGQWVIYDAEHEPVGIQREETFATRYELQAAPVAN